MCLLHPCIGLKLCSVSMRWNRLLFTWQPQNVLRANTSGEWSRYATRVLFTEIKYLSYSIKAPDPSWGPNW